MPRTMIASVPNPMIFNILSLSITRSSSFLEIDIRVHLVLEDEFRRRIVFLVAVARLARHHDIPLRTLSAARQGHDVVHGEILLLKRLRTVMAHALLQLVLPPHRRLQALGLFLFPFDALRAGRRRLAFFITPLLFRGHRSVSV